MKRFAIIQTAFIGDVALSLSLPQTIRNFTPDAEIIFITTPVAAPLARCAKAADKVIVFDKRNKNQGLGGIVDIARQVNDKNKIDYVLSLHRSLRSTMLAFKIKSGITIGFSSASLAFLFDCKVEYRASWHESARAISLLRAIDGFPRDLTIPKVDIEIPISDINEADKIWDDAKLPNEKVIAVAPGSVWATKRWPANYYVAAIIELRRRGYSAVLLGGKEDANLCYEIGKATGAASFAGKTTLPQTLRILGLCQVLLTNDSAPAHLAKLAGAPSITIFGPTSPQFGFASLGEENKIIEVEKLACRPCAIHGGKKCPIGTHECMKKISPQEVVAAVLRIVEYASLKDKNQANR